MHKIIRKVNLAPDICLFDIHHPKIAEKRKAGQFVIVKLDERGERIPLTIADSDTDRGTITLVVQEVGLTTSRLNAMNEGEMIQDVVGPLGSPTHIEKYDLAVPIGGGIGIAVAYPIAAALKKAGSKVISIIGSRNKDLLFYEDEMRKVSDELLISTDDGSYGIHGFVTDVLQQVIEEHKIVNKVYAIGPLPMMKAVCATTKIHNISTDVSLNPIMVDGTGMCGGCRVTVKNESRFACVDGPEFDGHQVDWDELLQRQKMYLEHEKRSFEEYHGHCAAGK